MIRGIHIAVAGLAVAFGVQAQVHRCMDSAGKIAYSDQPCPGGSKSSARMLGADATDRRWENEVYGRERNMRSIENASRIIQEPTSDATGGGGAAIMDNDPNERIRAQDERNMQRRMAEIEADQQRRAERDQARAAAPPVVTNCNASGCWDTAGNRYNRTGNGQNFWRSDGRFCRAAGNSMSCN